MCYSGALLVTEVKPLINANGREWKRMKRGCFTVVHREQESPPSSLLIRVHSRSLAVPSRLLESIRVHSRSFAVLFVGDLHVGNARLCVPARSAESFAG